MTKSLCWVKRLHSTTERKCVIGPSLRWGVRHSPETLEMGAIFGRDQCGSSAKYTDRYEFVGTKSPKDYLTGLVKRESLIAQLPSPDFVA